MGAADSSTKKEGADAPAAEAPATPAAAPSPSEILQALCKHADEVGHHVEKKQLMDYLAMDDKGTVLDKEKHDAARAKFDGAVDEKGDIADKDKFIAACDVVAGKSAAAKKEGKDKAKAKAKPKVELGSKICIRNLAEDMTSEKLTTLFESFGKIEKVDLKTKEGGKCKGFGFVAFGSADEASKAMAEMNDKEQDGKKLAVTLAFESQEGKGAEKGKGKGKDGKGADSKGKGKGKGKKGDPNAAVQANYQAYQAQVQAWYNLQMHAAMMTQWQAAQMQGWYAQQAYTSPKAAGAAAVGDGQEYTGIIKRVTARNGYGFIECAELKGKWKDDKNPEGRDIYVAANLIPETCKEPGSKVKFTLSFNLKGHPQAASCSPA
jgi:hypothetical protein